MSLSQTGFHSCRNFAVEVSTRQLFIPADIFGPILGQIRKKDNDGIVCLAFCYGVRTGGLLVVFVILSKSGIEYLVWLY